MSDLSHLGPKTQQIVDLPIDERIAYMRRDSWVTYPRAKEILMQLEDLLRYPKCDRMPNLAISAQTNNGKTRLIRHFLAQHQATDNPEGNTIKVPVLYVQCPGIPDEGRLYDSLLLKTCTRFRPSASAREKIPIVISVLSKIELGMIALDEVNYAEAGTITKQKQFLNALRYLGNELRVPFVALGTEEMMRVLRTVPAVENRFQPAALPRWQANEEARTLLASFEKMLPLRYPSDLQDELTMAKIINRCEGTIGELKALLIKLAELAMRNKKERITADLLDTVKYSPPSVRKKQPVPA